ncbi:hypothetical protein E1B28_012812 [Marasmius oreades]|uniref:Protein kinase domain-containing protein n=1 Tax=Marasmius oreades TaxID=181124 RepID=A0A9P7RTN8_9AGAR|nr:uncharacterized protein E1B28_012812 [Marasmius oreades]KAG7088858.1 hypothetical protein E1B28_012812 [Marasmius oreades]
MNTASPHFVPKNQPPRTPDRRNGSELASFSSTPYSKGTASHREEKHHTHKEIDEVLRHDIMNDKRVDLDLFMSTVLHTPNPPPSTEVTVIDEIVKSHEFTRLLEEYSKPVACEEEKYPRFTKLCRYSIARMVEKKITKNELGFTLCVNDPEYIRGSEGHRKPDVVGTAYKAIDIRCREWDYETNKRINNSNKKRGNKINGRKKRNGKLVKSQWTARNAPTPTLENIIDTITSPPKFPLMWSDLFMFAEFKVEQYDQQDIEEHSPSQQVPSPPPTISVTRRSKNPSNQTNDSQLTKASNSHPPKFNRAGSSHTTSRSGSTAGPLAPSGSGVGASGVSSRPGSTSSKRLHDDDDFTEVVEPQSKRLKITPVDIRVQCAGYAHLLFNRGGVRTHIIGALVTDNVLELLLYTRSGGCFTQPLNFVKDPSLFVRILLAFTRMTWSEWGFFNRLVPCTLSTPQFPVPSRETDPWMFRGGTLDVGENKCEVSDIRIFPRGLISRGTCTMGIKAESGKLFGKTEVRGLILKISSAPTTRQAEQVFIKKARVAADSRAQDQWVLDHLPDMLDSGEFEGTVSFEQLFGEEYEKRTLRYLVVEELFPITDLAGPEELRLALKDIVNCHRWLVTVPGIMHRDISVNNLMFRLTGDRKVGVLNDFDLACTMEENRRATSKQRTGTKPFIAIDLLTLVKGAEGSAKHFVRYDLESLVYVFAWIICRYENGQEIKDPPLEGWCKGNWTAVRTTKLAWLMDTESQATTPKYESLSPILDSLRMQIHLGYSARSRHSHVARIPHLASGLPPFKEETLGDYVTYDTVLAALDPPPPYTDAIAPS